VSLHHRIIECIEPQDLPAAVIAVIGKSAIKDIIFEKEVLIRPESSGAGPRTVSYAFGVVGEASVGNAYAVVDAVRWQIKEAMVKHPVNPPGNGHANGSALE